MTVLSDRLPVLDRITLKRGGHRPNGGEEMCLLEAVAFVTGEPWSDRPSCVSPILGDFGRAFNDALNDSDRQKLKPFLLRLPGTAGDGKDARRREMLSGYLFKEQLPRMLRAAGLEDIAVKAEEAGELKGAALRTALSQIESLTFTARNQKRAEIEAKLTAELESRGVASAYAYAYAYAYASAIALALALALALAGVDTTKPLMIGSDAWYEVRGKCIDSVRKAIDSDPRLAEVKAVLADMDEQGFVFFDALITAAPAA